MRIPTIHLNGTGRADLLREAESAYEAVGKAIAAVRDMTVHGRDYYVQRDANAYTQARDEHDRRLQRLYELQGELFDYYRAIEAQKGR